MSKRMSIPLHIKKLYMDAFLQQEKSLNKWAIAIQELMQSYQDKNAHITFFHHTMHRLTDLLMEMYVAKSNLWPIHGHYSKPRSKHIQAWLKLQKLTEASLYRPRTSKYRLSGYPLLMIQPLNGRRKRID
jgi:hypothetical protein